VNDFDEIIFHNKILERLVMKKLLKTIVKTMSISLCITTIVIPQALQQYTNTIVNGQEKWTLNKQYLSNLDEEEPPLQQIDPQNLFHQKLNSSPGNLFDDRWTIQLPYPTDTWLLAAEAENDFFISTGINLLSLSSIYSDLIISTDKGENWTIQHFGQNSLLISMDKYEDIVWLGGYDLEYNGFILKSTDLGNNWEKKLSADSFAVLYVNFFDENNGVVVSENILSSSHIVKIFHTTNGGNSWISNIYLASGYVQGPYCSHFSSHDLGWICISDQYSNDISRIINTTDGGLNWEIQFTDTVEEFEMIHFADLNHGWATGVWQESGSGSELRIYSTTNGGNDWSQQFTVLGEFGSFGSNMSSLDSLNCWLAVSKWPYLEIFRTTDGGNNWTEISQLQYVEFQLGDIKFISDTEGWIVSALGMIHYTSDGGHSWTPKHKSVTTENLYSLDFVDENTGWAASGGWDENVIIKTINGGTDWDIVFSDPTSSYVDMDFVSEQTGFIISENYFSNVYTINKTQDGGFNWDSTQFNDAELNDITFTDIDNGWSVGDNNSDLFITHTSNSGDGWHQQSNINLSGGSLNNVDFANSTNGFAVGDNGALIKTTDGGISWGTSWGNFDPNLFWIFYDLTGVYFPDPLNCWISGYSYSGGYRTMVARTTDAGANWDTLSFPSGYSRSDDIFFINDLDGYSVGNSSDYKTTDGGVTWTEIDYPSNVLKMFFLDARFGWAVGYNGRIFKYYDPNVGVEVEKDLQSPDNYVLMQNYPNPFNPSTTIRFTISDLPAGKQGLRFTILKVYDVLGNEVATLVNEEKPAGLYDVEWNAAGLPSGVYFYQLKIYPANGGAEGYTNTKKMLLLK